MNIPQPCIILRAKSLLMMKRSNNRYMFFCFGNKTLSKTPYCLSASEASEVQRQLVDYLQRGFIQPS